MLRNRTTREWIYYATGSRVGGGQHIAMRLHRGLGMTRNRHWTVAALGDFDGDGRATPMLRHRLYGGWVMYDLDGATSDVVRFPGLSTQRVWVAAGWLTQDNPPQLSRVEFLQGPPTYRKDYRTGKTIGPINASRAEAGEGLESWVWEYDWFGGPGVPFWFEDSEGFVTSVWQRRMVVAVEATHAYRAPAPVVTVELLPAEGEALSLDAVLLDVTEPDVRAGYRTELVFDLPAEHHLPGGELVVRVDGDGPAIEDRLPLFGETVETLSLMWIPITVDGYEPTGVGTDGHIGEVVPYLPIGPYRTKIGPPLTYQPTGQEEYVIDVYAMYDQLFVHHTAYACSTADVYFGIYPLAEMLSDGGDPAAIAGGGLGASRAAVGPSYPAGEEGWDGFYAHEVGHTLGLLHAPCNARSSAISSLDDEFPYPDGGLGAARSWHLLFDEFVDPESGYRDLMSYCEPEAISDYHYQRALMYLQAPHYAEWKLEADACWEKDAGDAAGVRSLAIVGRVAPDGTSTIIGTASSPHPPGTAGGGAPGDGWSLSVLDAGGAVVFQQSLALESDGHRHDAPSGQVWRARIPYPRADVPPPLLVVRGADGAVRMQEPLRVAR